MNLQSYFVTGTDTEVGKTWVTAAMLADFRSRGENPVGMKPISAGLELCDGQWVSADARQLEEAAQSGALGELINPYALKHAVSPHIAAAEENIEIDFQHILQCYETLAARYDRVLVEGVGGWLAPLSDSLAVADLAGVLGLPVVLVVGMRLGCLNHACLTANAIVASGLPFAGWVANCIDTQLEALEEQLGYLESKMPAPCLARAPYGQKPTKFVW